MQILKRNLLTVSFCLIALALYAYGVLSAGAIPEHIEGVALPLDFMVGIPAGFYVFVVRPRKLTLLSVIPVIWIGYGLSVLALGSPSAGILPYLLAALVPVELGIAIREVMRLVRIFKRARNQSADPMAWFKATMLYLVPKDIPASMGAAELSVWYYALCSWRKKPYVRADEKAFAYHNAGGYMNMMLGLAIALPIEVAGMHLLVSQWNVVAAVIVTALSLYAALWLIGDARARVMRPIAVGEEAVRLECGIQMEAIIPLTEIELVAFAESDLNHISKSEKLNYGTFYQPNVWVVVESPVWVRILFGKKRVCAIGLSVDDPKGFAEALEDGRRGRLSI